MSHYCIYSDKHNMYISVLNGFVKTAYFMPSCTVAEDAIKRLPEIYRSDWIVLSYEDHTKMIRAKRRALFDKAEQEREDYRKLLLAHLDSVETKLDRIETKLNTLLAQQGA